MWKDPSMPLNVSNNQYKYCWEVGGRINQHDNGFLFSELHCVIDSLRTY